MFADVVAKANKCYEDNEAACVGGRFPAVEVDRRRLEAFQEAVQRILVPSDAQRGLLSYCSQPVKFNGYKVCCVLQLNAAAYADHYSLPEGKQRASFRPPKSLIDSAAIEYLRACVNILGERKPGGNWEIRHKENDILRAAAEELLSRVAAEGCNAPLRYTFNALNTISLSTHEGAKAKGKVRFISHDHEDLITEVTFLRPVELKESRAARKMIEMANQKVDLLCNGDQIYGLGRVRDDYDEFYGEVYTVEFPGNHGWLLKHREHVLMKVHYGEPSLPRDLLEDSVFRDHVERIFQDSTEVDYETLVNIKGWAENQKHGTMIVISSGAEVEGSRLSKQCQPIEPVVLNEDNLLAVTSIDGAALIDPTGKCYAVGVIIDGVASEEGTSSRGARYNSAIRYVGTNTGNHLCLILVVSEDGTIDIVPELKARIRRAEIEEYVERLRAIKDSKTVSAKEYFRVMRWISAHSFYLFPEKCREVNDLKNAISSRPGVATSWKDFEPDKKMNETYFVDE